MEVSQSLENYLKAILILTMKRGCVHAVDIASYLSLSKASVSKALARLAHEGLIEVVNRDVLLTGEGAAVAERVLECHRMFERLLLDAGVDAVVASAEACRLEHCLQGDSVEKLSSYIDGGH